MGANSGRRLSKTTRQPEAFAGRRLTERSIGLIATIGRYRIVGTSALLRLADGNEDVTHRHLQMLFHRNIVGRVRRPGNTRNTEFAYFLEDSKETRAILNDGRLHLDELRGAVGRRRITDNASQLGRLLFISHELMISDFHADIEFAARESDERVQMEKWRQGTSTWDRVRERCGDGMLPHRPDAYCVLRFPTAAPGQQLSRFFYEADRGTTSTARFRAKLEAYLSFFLSGRYREQYGAERVRAILIETINEARRQQLMAVAADLAGAEPLASMLFWFATSGSLRKQSGFAAAWSTPSDVRLRSLLD